MYYYKNIGMWAIITSTPLMWPSLSKRLDTPALNDDIGILIFFDLIIYIVSVK